MHITMLFFNLSITIIASNGTILVPRCLFKKTTFLLCLLVNRFTTMCHAYALVLNFSLHMFPL